MLFSPFLAAVIFALVWSNDGSGPPEQKDVASVSGNPDVSSGPRPLNESEGSKATPSTVHSQNTGLINLRVEFAPSKSEEKATGFWNSSFWTGTFPAFLALSGVVATMLFNSWKDRRVLETAAQAEERMRAETLIKWVQLHSNGKDLAPLEQRLAALLVLAKSGFVEMAMTQLDSLWKREAVDAGTAVSIIDEGFRYTSEMARRLEKKVPIAAAEQEAARINDLAAMTLEYHAEKLVVGKDHGLDFYWPNQVEWKWRPEFSEYALIAIWQSLVVNLTNHPFKTWDRGTLRGAMVTLHAVMIQDKSNALVYASAKLINAMLSQFKAENVQVLYASDHRYRAIDELLSESEKYLNLSHDPLPTTLNALLNSSVAWCSGEFPKTKPAIMTM